LNENLIPKGKLIPKLLLVNFIFWRTLSLDFIASIGFDYLGGQRGKTRLINLQRRENCGQRELLDFIRKLFIDQISH